MEEIKIGDIVCPREDKGLNLIKGRVTKVVPLPDGRKRYSVTMLEANYDRDTVGKSYIYTNDYIRKLYIKDDYEIC